MLAVNVTVLGTTYSLYTHVHHHYGLNDAFDRGVTLLLERQQQDATAEARQARSGNASSSGVLGKQATRHAAGADSSEDGGSRRSAQESKGVAPRRSLLEVPAALLLQPAHLGASEDAAAVAAALRQQLERDWQADARTGGLRRRLAAAAPVAPRVQHPCLHTGYSQRYQRLWSTDQPPKLLEVQLEGR